MISPRIVLNDEICMVGIGSGTYGSVFRLGDTAIKFHRNPKDAKEENQAIYVVGKSRVTHSLTERTLVPAVSQHLATWFPCAKTVTRYDGHALADVCPELSYRDFVEIIKQTLLFVVQLMERAKKFHTDIHSRNVLVRMDKIYGKITITVCDYHLMTDVGKPGKVAIPHDFPTCPPDYRVKGDLDGVSTIPTFAGEIWMVGKMHADLASKYWNDERIREFDDLCDPSPLRRVTVLRNILGYSQTYHFAHLPPITEAHDAAVVAQAKTTIRNRELSPILATPHAENRQSNSAILVHDDSEICIRTPQKRKRDS